MQKKTILLATFVKPDYLEKFLNFLQKKFFIKKESTFIFEVEENNFIVTYKLYLDFDQKFDIKGNIKNTIQIHKKNKTFFTINALNKLIEKESNSDIGNIDYKKYEVDWSKYENKIILLKNNELDILDLKRKNL
jgi:hypothetical protein